MHIKTGNIKTDKRFAVIDLGTNTFNLLISEHDAAGMKELLHLEEPVKLGEGGINEGKIQSEAYQRGIHTMIRFSLLLKQYRVKTFRAIATSAIRNAENGRDFVTEVKGKAGMMIESIDGLREAEYIYKGVRSSGALNDHTALVMDIGGGSVEFIICNDKEIFWKESFEIGAARLMDKFHRQDPLSEDKLRELCSYLDQELQPLLNASLKFRPLQLIGSSGAFDTFSEMIEAEKGNILQLRDVKTCQFNFEEFIQASNWIIASDHRQRAEKKGIIALRVDMIVVAAVITRFVLSKLEINKLSMSAYSMKEGVMADLILS